MPAAEMPFSAQEYAARLEKTRNAMEAKGIDVLFVEDPSNMAWLTGYDGWSFYVHQGVIVFKDADPLWWGRSMDGNGAVRTVYMDDDRVLRYPDHYVQANTLHPMQHLAEILRAHGFGNQRIGVELENYYFSAKAYLVLKEELPNATFVDATALVNWQRAVKSDEEIVFMRRAARISEKMIDGIVERIEPGLKKNDLVAEIYADAIRGVDDDWGEYPAIVPLLPTGSDAAAPHLTWDGRRFEQGHATFFEIAGCYRRYHAPLCRTVFLGTPPQH
ncbi:aminopeptidase P family N-terminal domain-containing protein, partial [Nitratireductor rhodophyticola]